MLTTLYLRARWRSAPTLLNGTRPFRNADDAPQRMIRMIKINDMIRYVDIIEWDAQVWIQTVPMCNLSYRLIVIRNVSADENQVN